MALYSNFDIKKEPEVVEDCQSTTIEVVWLPKEAEQLKPKEEVEEGYVFKEELLIKPEILQQFNSTTDAVKTTQDAASVKISQSDVQSMENLNQLKLEKGITEQDNVESGDVMTSKVWASDCSVEYVKGKQFHVDGTPVDNLVHDTYVSDLPTHTDSGMKVYTCAHCNFSTNWRRSMVAHLPKHMEKKPYNCPHCEYSTSYSYSLKGHLRKHTGEKPYTCSYCKTRYTSQPGLKKHLSTHTGEKPYRCLHCKYSCSTNSSLKQHLKTHSKEKPYHCSYCKYTGSSPIYLKNHLKTHTNWRPYNCSYCKYTCKTSHSLKRHIRKHTGENPYQCSYCKHRCRTSRTLKMHLRIHTGEKPYICAHCKYGCWTKTAIKRHLRIHTEHENGSSAEPQLRVLTSGARRTYQKKGSLQNGKSKSEDQDTGNGKRELISNCVKTEVTMI